MQFNRIFLLFCTTTVYLIIIIHTQRNVWSGLLGLTLDRLIRIDTSLASHWFKNVNTVKKLVDFHYTWLNIMNGNIHDTFEYILAFKTNCCLLKPRAFWVFKEISSSSIHLQKVIFVSAIDFSSLKTSFFTLFPYSMNLWSKMCERVNVQLSYELL